MLAGHLPRGVTGLLLLAAVSTPVLSGCGDKYVAPPPSVSVVRPDATGAQAALNALVRDIRADRAGSGSVGAVVANAHALRVTGFTARYITDDGPVAADGSWSAEVDVRWRFAGFDAGSSHETVTATFGRDDRGTTVVRSFGGDDHRVPLWLTGPVTVRRDADALVLVAGGTHEADQYARLATRAVAAVRRVVPWPHPDLVLEVPASEQAMEQQLQVSAGSYAGVAAVTEIADGSSSPTAPVHVFVNPEAIGSLTETGAQVVISHEATHDATRAVETTHLPEWLLEGFADYVALRDVSLPLTTTAGQIRAQVAKQGVPGHLPGPAEFNARAEDFGAEYEAAWLACRTLADVAGEHALVQVYTRVRDGAPLETTMRQAAGFGVAHLTQLWQQRLRDLAR